MKRNRTAEAAKKQRLLNRAEVGVKRVSILLTELETAAGQVLREELAFSPEQAETFMEKLRAAFREIGGNQSADVRQIGVAFGIAGAKVLKEQYGFNEARLNWWIEKLVERGKKNRGKPSPSPSQGEGS